MKFNLKKKIGDTRSRIGATVTLLILLFIAAFMILPLIYTISSAFKPLDELWVFPPRFFVENPTLNNFTELMRIMNNSFVPFTRYIFNTILISVVGTFGHIILAALCAYAFSKRRFPGSNILFSMVVLTLMFNTVVTQIPTFLIITKLDWLDTYQAYIVPAFAAPIGLYLMKQFMDQMVPDSLLEAARIDGANELLIIFKIVMPIIKSAWITVIIFSFQALWNIGGNVYIYDEALKTFNYALSQILAGGILRAGVGAAAAVIMIIVPSIVFIISQRNIIETMATSGMKE